MLNFGFGFFLSFVPCWLRVNLGWSLVMAGSNFIKTFTESLEDCLGCYDLAWILSDRLKPMNT